MHAQSSQGLRHEEAAAADCTLEHAENALSASELRGGVQVDAAAHPTELAGLGHDFLTLV